MGQALQGLAKIERGGCRDCDCAFWRGKSVRRGKCVFGSGGQRQRLFYGHLSGLRGMFRDWCCWGGGGGGFGQMNTGGLWVGSFGLSVGYD